MTYDLLILGGGPAGFRAAERAGHFGLNVAIFEGKTLGGVCLNEGCIPTKTMLYSAKLYDYAKGGAEKYGVTAKEAALDHAFVVARKDKIVKKLVAGVEMQMKKARADVVRENGVLAGRNEAGEFVIEAGGEKFAGKNVLIATGSSAAVPPIPGLKEALADGFAVTNREILSMTEIPSKLVVMGAGAIGLEMASYFNSVGSDVTVVEMLDRIGGRIDRDIAALLQRNYTARGVKFLTGSRIQAIEAGRVRGVKSNGDEFELETEAFLDTENSRTLVFDHGHRSVLAVRPAVHAVIGRAEADVVRHDFQRCRGRASGKKERRQRSNKQFFHIVYLLFILRLTCSLGCVLRR